MAGSTSAIYFGRWMANDGRHFAVDSIGRRRQADRCQTTDAQPETTGGHRPRMADPRSRDSIGDGGQLGHSQSKMGLTQSEPER